MGIRAKLALALSLAVAAATAAAALGFVRLQYAALERADAEKTRVLLDSLRRVAEESRFAGDPLMLLDYASFLQRERPELHHCRVRLRGQWHDLGGQAPPEPSGGVERRAVAVPASGNRPPLELEVQLSQRVLGERLAAERAALAADALRSGAAVVLLGLAASALLAGAMTRRIVRIQETLAEIGEGRLGASVEDRGSDEVARLARGVNEMSERLHELDRLKRDFTASVTHELRSPLGAIQSQLRQLAGGPSTLDAEARSSLERIRRNAERLEHFVTSLLELARIERGKLDFAPREADFGRVVEDVALFFGPRAKEAGLELSVACESGVACVFDPDLVAQVVTNLVSNAIKFTPKGGRVSVAARRLEGGAAAEVADSGVGMPPEALGRIFSPFERVRNPLRATGTGLGLAISKSIAELHGGRIHVESEPGKGSTFRFELPAKPAA